MSTVLDVDWSDHIDQLAQAMEPEVLAKAEEVFAAAVDEHERQTDGYRFECRRWGDFLAVFIERAANEVWWGYGDADKKVAASLNLGATVKLELIDGHCFDRRGSVAYEPVLVADDGWVHTKNGTDHKRYTDSNEPFHAPSKGWKYAVEPQYPEIPRSRLMLIMGDKRDRLSYRDVEAEYKTENYPRPAKDDEIVFHGIEATIYAPAGKGRMVYDAILAEIAAGYEAKPLPA